MQKASKSKMTKPKKEPIGQQWMASLPNQIVQHQTVLRKVIQREDFSQPDKSILRRVVKQARELFLQLTAINFRTLQKLLRQHVALKEGSNSLNQRMPGNRITMLWFKRLLKKSGTPLTRLWLTIVSFRLNIKHLPMIDLNH